MIIDSKNLKGKLPSLGGKANSLIKMTQLGLPVPEFLVIPSKYFKGFVKYNNLEKDIKSLFKEKKLSEIKSLIYSHDLDESSKNEISELVDKLNLKLMSVRSSADNEDGKEKSFAGQYETFLNVKKKDLYLSIRKCWASVFEDNVISYTGKIDNLYCVNVVVQKMITPNFAGVAFSLDPLSRSKNYSVIECCEGNGEKLVSGQTTPVKYMVRKENCEVDMIIGKPLLSNNEIAKLEKYILSIEEAYGFAVDVEYAFDKGKIYILQARPITAIISSVEVLKQTLQREKKLFELEIYYHGEYFGIKELTGGLYYFNPIFEFVSPNNTRIYYNDFSLEEYPNSILRELDKNFKLLKEKYEEVKSNCKAILDIMDNDKDFDIVNFVNMLKSIQPFSSLGNLAGKNWKVSDRVKELLYDYRNNYDYIIYKSTEFLYNKLVKLVPSHVQPYLSVLKLQELVKQKYDIEILKKRMNGFIYFDGKLYFKTLAEFCKSQKLSIEEDNGDISKLQGNVACGGKNITGKVKIVMSVDDFGKFEKDDILVTSMTTPKFTSIMKIAKGIITDEGGVTCHASIVARELKKPCIVGCKYATKLLKDGMTIKLDTKSGKISIIE